jgi:hypothetical protein
VLSFPWSLAIMCVLALISLDIRTVRTALALSIDWFILHRVYLATGDQYNWQLKIAVDTLAAVAILTRPGSSYQSVVGASYALEIVAHIAFGLSSQDNNAQYRYWWFQCWISWLQVGVVLLWIFLGNGKVGSHIRRAYLRLASISSRAGNVEGATRKTGGVNDSFDFRKWFPFVGRTVRLTGVQHAIVEGSSATGSTEISGGNGTSGDAANISVGSDGRGGSGARDCTTCRNGRNNHDADGVCTGCGAGMMSWLPNWLSHRPVILTDHISRMENAADSLRETHRRLLDNRR